MILTTVSLSAHVKFKFDQIATSYLDFSIKLHKGQCAWLATLRINCIPIVFKFQ